ncbi:MAG: hypothetical protein JNL70_06855 [Saprospiraceae bacterium]|nr:hypothetical protein [Saprospiraceae bacterium]
MEQFTEPQIRAAKIIAREQCAIHQGYQPCNFDMVEAFKKHPLLRQLPDEILYQLNAEQSAN